MPEVPDPNERPRLHILRRPTREAQLERKIADLEKLKASADLPMRLYYVRQIQVLQDELDGLTPAEIRERERRERIGTREATLADWRIELEMRETQLKALPNNAPQHARQRHAQQVTDAQYEVQRLREKEHQETELKLRGELEGWKAAAAVAFFILTMLAIGQCHR